MAYTDTSAVAGLVKTAYDRYVEFALRSQPLFRSLADKRPVQQAMPGSSVVFSLYQDLAAATGTLTETTDPTAVALSDVTTVSVTLNEYGNSVLQTRKLEEFAFSQIDPAVANIIAFNMADSLDSVAVAALIGGTNKLYSGSATATSAVTAAMTLSGANIRKANINQIKSEVDALATRDQIKESLISAWSTLQNATAQIQSANTAVSAGELSLQGIVQERDVGQATTLDVLNAQSELESVREGLVQASAAKVIASFAVVAATGHLTAADLSLPVQIQTGEDYIAKVEDVWAELRALD